MPGSLAKSRAARSVERPRTVGVGGIAWADGKNAVDRPDDGLRVRCDGTGRNEACCEQHLPEVAHGIPSRDSDTSLVHGGAIRGGPVRPDPHSEWMRHNGAQWRGNVKSSWRSGPSGRAEHDFRIGFRFSLDYTPYLILLLALGGRPFTRLFWLAAFAGFAVNAWGAAVFNRLY